MCKNTLNVGRWPCLWEDRVKKKNRHQPLNLLLQCTCVGRSHALVRISTSLTPLLSFSRSFPQTRSSPNILRFSTNWWASTKIICQCDHSVYKMIDVSTHKFPEIYFLFVWEKLIWDRSFNCKPTWHKKSPAWHTSRAANGEEGRKGALVDIGVRKKERALLLMMNLFAFSHRWDQRMSAQTAEMSSVRRIFV